MTPRGDSRSWPSQSRAAPTCRALSSCARGWSSRDFEPRSGRTRFELVSDRDAAHPVVVELARSCDVGGATPTTPRADGVRTYLAVESIATRYAGTLSDVFPGGCVTYQFDFARGPHISLIDDFEHVVGLRSRHDLRIALHDRVWDRSRSMTAVRTRAQAKRRAALGAAVFAASLIPLRRRSVGPREQELFRAVNGLPDRLYVPAWLVMQLGTVGAAPAAATLAWTRGDRRLAARLLAAGVTTWGASKLVKRVTRRPRPVALLHDAHVRGREAAGLGFPSGHAGVAVALGVAAWHRLDHRGRLAAAVLMPIVGGTRVYVGAHLPLDAVSGAALGLTLDTLVEWVLAASGACA